MTDSRHEIGIGQDGLMFWVHPLRNDNRSSSLVPGGPPSTPSSTQLPSSNAPQEANITPFPWWKHLSTEPNDMKDRNYDANAIDQVKEAEALHEETTEQAQTQSILTLIKDKYKTTDRDTIKTALIKEGVDFTRETMEAAIEQYKAEEAEKARKASEKAEADRKAAEAAKAAADLKKAEAEAKAKVDSQVDTRKDQKGKVDSQVDTGATPQKLRLLLKRMWDLSAWHKGHLFVLREANATSNDASFPLARHVYKTYIDSNGSQEAFDELLRRHGIDPNAPIETPTSTHTSTQTEPLPIETPPQTPNSSVIQPPNPNVGDGVAPGVAVGVAPGAVGGAAGVAVGGAQGQGNPLFQWVTPLDAEDAEWLNTLFHDPEYPATAFPQSHDELLSLNRRRKPIRHEAHNVLNWGLFDEYA